MSVKKLLTHMENLQTEITGHESILKNFNAYKSKDQEERKHQSSTKPVVERAERQR